MKNSIENTNKITLNLIQKELNVSAPKTIFLKMIFPESFKNEDSNGLLDFIFESDSSYQSSRTSFFNGNIYKKGSTYSRAHQAELSYMAMQFNTSSVFEDMASLIFQNFDISNDHKVFKLLPLDAEKYPQSVSNAIDAYQNTNESYKLLALMILWSIFGEWITLLSLENKIKTTDLQKNNAHTDETLVYFNKILASSAQIENINFAFQSGALWLTDAARTNLLIKLIDDKIHINVIIASFDPTEFISGNARYSRDFFKTVHAMWCVFSQKYPDYVKVKVSPVPLMHNYYEFNMKDPSQNVSRLNFYTSHNPYIDKNPVYHYDTSSAYYTLFKDEFNYLWKLSKDIQKKTNILRNE